MLTEAGKLLCSIIDQKLHNHDDKVNRYIKLHRLPRTLCIIATFILAIVSFYNSIALGFFLMVLFVLQLMTKKSYEAVRGLLIHKIAEIAVYREDDDIDQIITEFFQK